MVSCFGIAFTRLTATGSLELILKQQRRKDAIFVKKRQRQEGIIMLVVEI